MLPKGQLIVEKISDVGCPMYQIVQSVVANVHTEGYNCPAGFPLHYLVIRRETMGMFIHNLNTRIFGKST
jgi:hypothetical protein